MEEETSNVSIRPEIDKLLLLQEKDTKILELTEDLEEQPRKIAALRESFLGQSQDLNAAKEESKAKQAEMKKIELEVESTKQEILKHSNQLFQVKTNEEYKALEKEIALEKSQSGEKEDVILEDMMVIDGIKEKIKTLEEAHAKDEAVLKEQEVVIEERIKNLKAQIEQLQGERHSIEVDVRDDILSLYNRVLNIRPESPVVPVRDHICMGCHMELIHQSSSDVKRCTEMVFCENCSRILYEPVE